MSYKNAAQVLPEELLRQVQKYADGEYLYIPRAAGAKRDWGTATAAKRELAERNIRIYRDYLAGTAIAVLAEKYFLAPKSIQRIIGQMKKETQV